MERRRRIAVAASLALALGACRGPGGAPAKGPVEASSRGERAAVRAARQDSGDAGGALDLGDEREWLAIAPSAFAARHEARLLAPGGLALAANERHALIAALARPGEPAVRAAVLLGHALRAGDAEAGAALLERLEAREPGPSRAETAGDVVAAAAFAGNAEASRLVERAAERLADLASGARPHPELDVRVECARSALALGHDAVAPFLLSVLRAETPDQALDPPNWPRVTTLAWPKSRAAEALAARAGVASTFRPDASWADQMAGANELARALGLE